MTGALIILGILMIWYGIKAVKANPENPNWARVFLVALFWPLSLFSKRNRF